MTDTGPVLPNTENVRPVHQPVMTIHELVGLIEAALVRVKLLKDRNDYTLTIGTSDIVVRTNVGAEHLFPLSTLRDPNNSKDSFGKWVNHRVERLKSRHKKMKARKREVEADDDDDDDAIVEAVAPKRGRPRKNPEQQPA